MEVKILNSTSNNHSDLWGRIRAAKDLVLGKYELKKSEALDFGGKEAGICYLTDDVKDIFHEDSSLTNKRVARTLDSGHQSVYGHPVYNLVLSGFPKFFAMILNNEKVYTTSEKSARYTVMQPAPEEKRVYDKWFKIIDSRIEQTYPGKFKQAHRAKLAQENARYMISVFTPTIFGHSLDFRQINYLQHWFNDFIESAPENQFNSKLKKSMWEFNSQLEHLHEPRMKPKDKERYMSLFSLSKRGNVQNEFGENYCVTYPGSFAYLAQAHRHRTLDYRINEINNVPTEFFVPPIISGDDFLVDDWMMDIHNLAHSFPQGALVEINERGTVENLISKAGERLCGHAQLEIAIQTKKTIDVYASAVKDSNQDVFNLLEPYTRGARCTFPDYVCPSKCVLGGGQAFKRLI